MIDSSVILGSIKVYILVALPAKGSGSIKIYYY